jgi:FkbM family methyltransferase
MGQYSLMAARLGANAIAFEPDPSSQDLCLRNAKLNGLEIDLVKSAVGDAEGPTRLTREDLGSSTSHLIATGDGFRVNVVTLDGFCELNGIWPDVMKVDIEGGEIVALGDAATKTLNHVRALVVEMHEPTIAATGHSSAWLLSRLAKNRRRIDLESRWDGNYNVAFVRD